MKLENDPGRGPGRRDRRDGLVPGEHPGDDVLPCSPGRRRVATIIALALIALILTFLVWFIATNTEREEGGSMLGFGSVPIQPQPPRSLVVAPSPGP